MDSLRLSFSLIRQRSRLVLAIFMSLSLSTASRAGTPESETWVQSHLPIPKTEFLNLKKTLHATQIQLRARQTLVQRKQGQMNRDQDDPGSTFHAQLSLKRHLQILESDYANYRRRFDRMKDLLSNLWYQAQQDKVGVESLEAISRLTFWLRSHEITVHELENYSRIPASISEEVFTLDIKKLFFTLGTMFSWVLFLGFCYRWIFGRKAFSKIP